jgi:hypothetical protein
MMPHRALSLSAVASLALASACALHITVGDIPADAASSVVSPDAAAPPQFPLPFVAGFEAADGGCGFADWMSPAGACYTAAGGVNALVESPVHAGSCAASFTTVVAAVASQARCYLEGDLSAPVVWFTAWFYVPSPLPTLTSWVGSSSWNIMHFVSGVTDGGTAGGVLDVNFTVLADGTLSAVLFDILRHRELSPTPAVSLPQDTWFKLSLRFVRSSTATGAWSLYQDGTLTIDTEGLVTAPEPFMQFFVGNLTDSLAAGQTTVFVDDISVSTAGP